jgi:hypothetical protein
MQEENYSQLLSTMTTEQLEMELAAIQQCLSRIHPVLYSTKSQLEEDIQLIKNFLNNSHDLNI